MLLADLVFLFLLLLAAGTFVLAAGYALRREYRRAGLVLWRLLLAAAVYMLCVIAISLFGSRRVVKIGEPQCFDDWCVAITVVNKEAVSEGLRYTVDLQLASRALRVPQRERYMVVYLIDNAGRRFDPVPNASEVPFGVLLQPGQSMNASRSFLLPLDAAHVSAVVTHEGGFPIEWLVAGYDAWFRKPPIVEIP
jgi:hypothetical protein